MIAGKIPSAVLLGTTTKQNFLLASHTSTWRKLLTGGEHRESTEVYTLKPGNHSWSRMYNNTYVHLITVCLWSTTTYLGGELTLDINHIVYQVHTLSRVNVDTKTKLSQLIVTVIGNEIGLGFPITNEQLKKVTKTTVM